MRRTRESMKRLLYGLLRRHSQDFRARTDLFDDAPSEAERAGIETENARHFESCAITSSVMSKSEYTCWTSS